ncbi:MAG TPA: histidine kinase [Cyclobacteriaceae bacterium]|nr:histidine kinase [Cyclobacteriaceae bacterium]
MDEFFTRLVLSDDRRARVGRHVLFWATAWTFQGLIYGFLYPELNAKTFVISFSEALMYLPMHMTLAYSLNYIVLPKLIFRGKYWPGFLAVIGLIVITAFLAPLTLYYIINPFRKLIGSETKWHSIFFSFMGGLRGALTVTGFFVAIKLIKQWYLKKSENELLEKEKLRAELELLKGQLHPHFMFNTLNSIYSMALRNSTQTADAIHKLSNLMRYMITECNTPAISLEQEIQAIKTYIELEKSRLGDRLDHTLNIQGQLAGYRIAPLLLLPFVENSFKHGAYMAEDQAWVSLTIVLKDDQFVFKLINGKNTQAKPPTSGIGLANVKKRLNLLYPQSHDLRISEDEETFVVSLTLMLDKITVPTA